jgi:hypothetical protein
MLLRLPVHGLHHLLRPQHLRVLSNAAATLMAPLPAPTDWTEALVSTPDASLFHVSLDLSSHAPLLVSHVIAGQFLPSAPTPSFSSSASPSHLSTEVRKAFGRGHGAHFSPLLVVLVGEDIGEAAEV